MEIVNTFKLWRNRSKLSQKKVGELFNVSHAAVSDWERGKSDIPNRVIEKLWTKLNQTASEPIEQIKTVDIYEVCISCEEPLLDRGWTMLDWPGDDGFQVLECSNKDCPRHGLLTTISK